MARTLDDLDVAGKRVLVRGDLNVPMRAGVVSDVTRIKRLAPTLIELAERGARVVVMSHFGRPQGRRDETMSLRALAEPLGAALGGRGVAFAEDCIGAAAEAVVSATVFSFLVYSGAVIWAFATRSALRAWLGIAAPTVVCVAVALLGAPS